MSDYYRHDVCPNCWYFNKNPTWSNWSKVDVCRRCGFERPTRGWPYFVASTHRLFLGIIPGIRPYLQLARVCAFSRIYDEDDVKALARLYLLKNHRVRGDRQHPP